MSKDPYLDPASGLLRNLAGITDADELARAEAAYTRKRIRELELRPISGHFDLAHLRAIHRHIAQDLFDWAGELRTVDIAKGQMFCPVQNLASYAKEVFGKLAALDYLRGRSREDFVSGVAAFYGDLNALHPFRDFNGRSQRALTSQLVRHAGWHIAWDRLDPQQNPATSIASFTGDNSPMREMFDDLTEPFV